MKQPGVNDMAINILSTITYNAQHRELMERNLKRVEEAKLAMGKRWILHPENSVKRKKEAK
jgi:hypothetical protein